MQAAANTVVRFHYRVSEGGAGEAAEIESSHAGGEPLAILLGHGGIIPGLEAALIGKSAGEQFEVEIEPEQAYGPLRANFTQRVPKKYFREPAKLKPGMQTAVNTDHGARLVTILKVGMSVVDVDLNHPMAGKTLRFAVDVVDVREATEEERAHGHAHGAGGHQHD